MKYLNSEFYFIYCGDKLAGYIKLNSELAQSDIKDKKSLELERIYVSKSFQGTGIGTYLISQVVRLAKEKEKEYLWLGVWGHYILT